MKQFHQGISSKTFKKDTAIKIRPIDLIAVAVIGLALSINV